MRGVCRSTRIYRGDAADLLEYQQDVEKVRSESVVRD
jgi:hypothetical protein